MIVRSLTLESPGFIHGELVNSYFRALVKLGITALIIIWDSGRTNLVACSSEKKNFVSLLIADKASSGASKKYMN